MATTRTVLMIDAPDAQGYAGEHLGDQAIAAFTRALREVWPRRDVLIDRSAYATDARRLRALPLAAAERVVVVRPGACLLPVTMLRTALAEARTRQLDVARISGIADDVGYIVTPRAIALAADVGGVPGCVTVPQVLERLAAAGASFDGRHLTSGSVSAQTDAEMQTLVAALSPAAWAASRVGDVLARPSTERLREAMRLQHQALGDARADLRRLAGIRLHRQAGVHTEVLVVVPSMFQSGAHAAWSALADDLSPAQVAFVVGQRTDLRRVLDARGFRVVALQDGLVARSAVDAATFLTALAEMRPAVVHFDGTEGGAWVAAVHGQGIRVIQHVRLNDVERFSAAFPYADAVVGVSPHVCRAVTARVGPAVRVEHIPDGVPVRTRPAPIARASDTPVVCLCVGRVEPAKGQLRVLDIFGRLRERLPCRLVIVGPCGRDAAYCDEVRDRIRVEYPGGEVAWEPFRMPLDDLYAEADVVLVGSRNEALGMVGLEALAAGALLVAHRSTGYASIIDPDRQEGLLFDAAEPAADVAARIVAALQDQRTYAANGRRRIETDFAARDTSARLARLWTDVAAAR